MEAICLHLVLRQVSLASVVPCTPGYWPTASSWFSCPHLPSCYRTAGIESQTTLSGFYVNSRNWAQVGWLSRVDPFPSRKFLKWTVLYGSPSLYPCQSPMTQSMRLTAWQVLLKSFWHVFAVCPYAHTCRDQRTVGSRHWTWADRLVSKPFTHWVILLAQSLPRRQVNEPKETHISITQVYYAMCPDAFETYEHAEKTLRDR